jgi:hypothetical protein
MEFGGFSILLIDAAEHQLLKFTEGVLSTLDSASALLSHQFYCLEFLDSE